MKLHELLTDDDAVSPVIGVILMVAITVILAAVIGSFVLGLGSNVNSTPSASFSFDFDDGSNDAFGASDGDDSVEITHDGGDTVDASALTVVVDGTEVTPDEWSSDVTAGDSETVTDGDAAMESDDTIRIVWSSGDDKTATLGSANVP